MNSYKRAMDQITVTPDMETRINARLKGGPARESRKGRSFRSWPAACAACMALLISAVILVQPGRPQVQPPLTTVTRPVRYQAVAQLAEALPFTLKTPAGLEDKYEITEIAGYNKGEMGEIIYSAADSVITFRTCEGEKDVSGDYNQYEEMEKIEIAGVEVTLSGSGGKVFLATWSRDGLSFSLAFSGGIDADECRAIIESV